MRAWCVDGGEFRQLARPQSRSFHGFDDGEPQGIHVDDGGGGRFAFESEVQEAALSWIAGVVVGGAFAPSVTFLKANLEDEVLAESVHLVNESACVVRFVVDFREEPIGIEEDGLWNEEVLIFCRDWPGNGVSPVGSRRVLCSVDDVVNQYFGDVGSASADVEDCGTIWA